MKLNLLFLSLIILSGCTPIHTELKCHWEPPAWSKCKIEEITHCVGDYCATGCMGKPYSDIDKKLICEKKEIK